MPILNKDMTLCISLAARPSNLGTRFHNWGPVAPEVHATFLASYCASYPLTADEESWLPLLLIVYSIELMGPTTSGPHGDLSMQLINQYTRQLTAQK